MVLDDAETLCAFARFCDPKGRVWNLARLGASALPLWVRGGVQIVSADGGVYEVRSRVTLCRCGASSNKPFCDGSHASIGFDDRK